MPHDEAKHPRGQPDNAGQFKSKPIPAPPPVSRRPAKSAASPDRRQDPYARNLLERAIADGPDGLLTRALQAESPDGLAHSTICALHRGEQPSREAQAALDATITWRRAWNQWAEAYGPWHVMQSRLGRTVDLADEAVRRATTARDCLAWHGGSLGDLSVADASMRLRGAFVQGRKMIDADRSGWDFVLKELCRDLRGHVSFWQPVAPNGTRLPDLDPDSEVDPHPATQSRTEVIAAWAKVFGTDGLRRAARRWATAASAPIFAAESAAQRAAKDVAREVAETDPVLLIGADNIAQMLDAARTATNAGVRLRPHQANAVHRMAQITQAQHSAGETVSV